MLSLIAKDFKLLFASGGSGKKRVLSVLSTILMMGTVIAIELLLFTTILKNVRQFNNASMPFLTLFLFVISCLMILLNTVRANQLFFNPKDIEQLVRRPVSNGQIVASKLIFLFASHYVMTFLLVYPILVAYGILVGKTVGFFYVGIFYPAVSFLFEGGVALILVYPYKLLTDFLKKHSIVQFVLALVLMVGGCMLYSRVLSLFMEIVVNDNINALFTKSSIDKLIDVKQYLVPVNFLADAFFASYRSRMLFYICIAGGLFVGGVALTVFSFSYLRSVVVHARVGKVKEQLKISHRTVALIKKELYLLFKDSNNILSFTGLLIVQPFLVYVVINAINSVLFSGKLGYQMMAFPAFVPLLNVLIVMLFTLIINQGANEYIQSEKGNVRVMKTIPVNPLLQLAIKVAVPFGLSTLSLAVTVAVLFATGLFAPMTACFSFLMTWILLAVFVLVSLKEEMRVSNNKPRSSWLSTCYSYLLPFSFFGVSLVACWNGMQIGTAYVIGLVLFLLLSAPHVIKLKQKLEDLFLDLEMVN